MSQRYRHLGSIYQSLRHILRKKTPLFRHFATFLKKSSYVKSVWQTIPPQSKNKIKTNAFIKISEKAISLNFVREIAQAHSSKSTTGSYFGDDSISVPWNRPYLEPGKPGKFSDGGACCRCWHPCREIQFPLSSYNPLSCDKFPSPQGRQVTMCASQPLRCNLHSD